MLMRVSLPEDRGHLGQDGDAALALEIVGIHRALGDALILAEGAGLLQQAVDQRGLAMVDMGDDGDIAQIHSKKAFDGAKYSDSAPGRRWSLRLGRPQAGPDVLVRHKSSGIRTGNFAIRGTNDAMLIAGGLSSRSLPQKYLRAQRAHAPYI